LRRFRNLRLAVLILSAFSLYAQQPAAVSEKCALAGTVFDAMTGTPLAKAEVVAQDPEHHKPGASTTTDTKGNFRIVDLDPAQYRIRASHNGYLDAYFGARKSFQSGTIITLTGGQTLEGFQVKLSPFGVIAGVVRDADGDPIDNASIVLYASRFSKGERKVEREDSTETNDLGEYRFAHLEPGRYYISAHPEPHEERTIDHSPESDGPRVFPTLTFYPDSPDSAAAVPIDLEAGARRTGTNITLQKRPLYTISAHVDTPPGMRASVTLGYPEDRFGIDNEATVDKDNNVTVTGISSGSYVMRVHAAEPRKSFDGTVDFFADRGMCNVVSIPVVIDHANIEGLHASVKACGWISGHVIVRDEKGQQRPANSRLTEILTDHESKSVVIKEDGSFRASLSSGHHAIGFPDISRQHLYVASIRAGNQDVLRGGFSTSDSEQIDLEAVLASDGGTISGTVVDAEDKPAAGAIIAVIPSDPALRARKDFTWNTVADQSGHFEMKGIAPNEYKVFAWADIEEEGWFDPETLNKVEGKGEPVSVKAMEASPALKLHPIP
jgi:hypothetical protein